MRWRVGYLILLLSVFIGGAVLVVTKPLFQKNTNTQNQNIIQNQYTDSTFSPTIFIPQDDCTIPDGATIKSYSGVIRPVDMGKTISDIEVVANRYGPATNYTVTMENPVIEFGDIPLHVTRISFFIPIQYTDNFLRDLAFVVPPPGTIENIYTNSQDKGDIKKSCELFQKDLENLRFKEIFYLEKLKNSTLGSDKVILESLSEIRSNAIGTKKYVHDYKEQLNKLRVYITVKELPG